EATLSSRISAARRAVGDSGNDQSLIRTIHKRGFRFVGSIDEEDADSATPAIANGRASDDSLHATPLAPSGEPLPATDDSAPGVLRFAAVGDDPHRQLALAVAEAPRRAPPDDGADALPDERVADAAPTAPGTASQRRGNARPALLIGAAVALSAATVAWWLTSAPSPSAIPQAHDRIALASNAAASTDRSKPRLPSVAVLPFINLSGDASQDYLADGITDSLISELVHALPGIFVV